MWTFFINCVYFRYGLLRSCRGFGYMFNLATLGAITFFSTRETGRQTSGCLYFFCQRKCLFSPVVWKGVWRDTLDPTVIPKFTRTSFKSYKMDTKTEELSQVSFYIPITDYRYDCLSSLRKNGQANQAVSTPQWLIPHPTLHLIDLLLLWTR